MRGPWPGKKKYGVNRTRGRGDPIWATIEWRRRKYVSIFIGKRKERATNQLNMVTMTEPSSALGATLLLFWLRPR
jgi:hypothetical protein